VSQLFVSERIMAAQTAADVDEERNELPEHAKAGTCAYIGLPGWPMITNKLNTVFHYG